MKELTSRLSAVDPDAGAAVQVIAYFDRLAATRAGVEALVRGAAVLAGCPARLVDPGHAIRVRVEADGTRSDRDDPPDPAWPSAAVPRVGSATLWLERATGSDVVDAVILERAAGVIREVLDRTRGRAPAAADPALVETVLDTNAAEQARLHAARQLGFSGSEAQGRALATPDGQPHILLCSASTRLAGTELPSGRVGVGPARSVLHLPDSWAAARTALRFTAEGTPQDPGERVVYADDLGGIAALAGFVAPGSFPLPDVRALEAATADAPWMLTTLQAVASTASLRAAAAEINVHHSTLQKRIAHAEGLLGWPVHTPKGRLRLQLALLMRQLARS
ncbi:helix-turn-helix domain-containing protein [Streptomyces sp. NPDC048277]|uniref:helix-turn-helix domain-containing protein n=1 Tax=Streptomyces sp. NPDC048277 TaxID=3155027 RepID=UPI00340ABC6A